MSAPPAPTPAARFRPAARDVLVLGSMCALHAMSIDMYLSSLPDVEADLVTSVTAAQLTMTAMLVGAAIGQLVIGPLSDRLGRRRPVLVGIAFHVALSLACAAVSDIWVLVALRAAQGFFVAASNVVPMASIRDRFVGADAAKLMSRLMLVIGVAPLFAPSVGGAIAGLWGWRAVFVALATFGVVLWFVVWRFLPETLPPARRRAGGLRAAAAGYLTLLRDRHFVALATLPGLAGAVLMSYVVASPFVLRTGFGLTQQQFSLVFAANGVGLVLGAQVNAALVHRFAPLRILRTALVSIVALCGVLFALAETGAGGLPALLVVLWLTLSLINLVSPNANALALSRHGEVAGTAAAVGGAVSVSLAAVATPLSGLLGGDARAMATVMVAAASIGVAVLALATPAFRRGRPDERAADVAPAVLVAPTGPQGGTAPAQPVVSSGSAAAPDGQSG